MADRMLLRLSAVLLFIGLVLSTLAQFPHPGGGATYEETFANYAASPVADWAAILLKGLLVLYAALSVAKGMPHWLGLVGAVATGMALTLAGVLLAVDGVALKHAVDAWASAPAADTSARLASAEAIRFVEFGTNSYWEYMRGLALVLYGITIVWTARVPRPIGVFFGVAGLAFLDLGWLVGTRGFTPADGLPENVGYGCLFALTIWLLIVAWRMKEVQVADAATAARVAPA